MRINTKRTRKWILLPILFVLLIGALASFKTQREFVASCMVKVTGKEGHPVANIRVSEGWNAYSYDLSGGLDLQTNADGNAYFPEQTSTHSLLIWYLSPLVTRLNYGVHASSGSSASFGISEPGLSIKNGETSGFTCVDQQCIAQPITFEMKLVDR